MTRHDAKLSQSELASLVERPLFEAFVSAGCTALVEALLQASATATTGMERGRKRPLILCGSLGLCRKSKLKGLADSRAKALATHASQLDQHQVEF